MRGVKEHVVLQEGAHKQSRQHILSALLHSPAVKEWIQSENEILKSPKTFF